MKDYNAILTIHDINTMNSKEIKRVSNWLIKIGNNLKTVRKEDYNKICRFRLMK